MLSLNEYMNKSVSMNKKMNVSINSTESISMKMREYELNGESE